MVLINKFKNLLACIIPNEIVQKFSYRQYLQDGCVIGREVEIINSKLESRSRYAHHSSIRNSVVGNYSSIGRNTYINHAQIGKFCSISWNVTIGATSHPTNRLTTHAFPYVARIGFVDKDNQHCNRVSIGNDVWIGCHSVIMPGITIGHGSIIGAGAVVTKDIPDYAIAAGNPAKVMRYRCSEEMIKKLLEISWWDFSKDKIMECLGLFQQDLNEDVLAQLLRIREQMD